MKHFVMTVKAFEDSGELLEIYEAMKHYYPTLSKDMDPLNRDLTKYETEEVNNILLLALTMAFNEFIRIFYPKDRHFQDFHHYVYEGLGFSRRGTTDIENQSKLMVPRLSLEQLETVLTPSYIAEMLERGYLLQIETKTITLVGNQIDNLMACLTAIDGQMDTGYNPTEEFAKNFPTVIRENVSELIHLFQDEK